MVQSGSIVFEAGKDEVVSTGPGDDLAERCVVKCSLRRSVAIDRPNLRSEMVRKRVDRSCRLRSGDHGDLLAPGVDEIGPSGCALAWIQGGDQLAREIVVLL